MYLNEIFLQNTGPISECHVKPQFDEGKPLPIVIVGPNGSGKTIFLSYIVDALMEFAKRVFNDIVPSDGLSSPFFRIVSPTTIKSRERFSLSLLRFKTGDSDLSYCEKSGTLDRSTYSSDLKSVFAPVWNWPTKENHKDISVNEKTIETEMRKGAYAFFPASRRETPDWLNPNSIKDGIIEGGINVSANRHFAHQLDKPIWIETCAEENIGWILDVFLDSSVDVELLWKLQVTEAGERILPNASLSQIKDIENRNILRNALRNVDRVLKKILQDSTAKLRHTFRNHKMSRLVIELEGGQKILTPNSLSGGQSQLFHLFTTIIRYGESTDINKSIHLPDITGLVIIDEIDANLHPTLQHDVLPELIAMFPKVQFIVSSHSPLFLLGMEKRFGADKVAILELPEAKRINSERYSEFGKAFEFYKTTERFEEDIKQLIASATKPVVLTEGKTDARYIQTALELLGEEELLNSLDIRPVGKESNEGDNSGGHTGLNSFRNIYEAHPFSFNHAILLLYDWDANKSADQIEKLWVRSIPKNVKEPEEKRGIENLFPLHLFKDCFYQEKPKKGVHGKSNVIHEFRKQEFCQWICEEQRNPDDFENFKGIVEILKEFVEVHQPAEVQQPPE